MSHHETLEAGVLAGVALLFCVAILCISIDPDWFSVGAATPVSIESE